jgi:hypothetical protein
MKLTALFFLVLSLTFLGCTFAGAPSVSCRSIQAILEIEETTLDYELDAELEEMETLQSNTCSDKFVCKYKCIHARKCRKTGFFDLTDRLKQYPDEQLAYDYVCNTRIFSYSGAESGEPVSMKFNNMVIEELNKQTNSRYTFADFKNKMSQDKTRFKGSFWCAKIITWAVSLGMKRDVDAVKLLLLYKDGLRGFSKLCSQHNFSTSEVRIKLKELNEQKQKQSLGNKKRIIDSNSLVGVYKELAKINSNSRKKFMEFKSILDEVVINSIKKGNNWKCGCWEYKRFFAKLERKSKSDLINNYGFSPSFDLQNMKKTYNEWMVQSCTEKCKK